VRNYFTAQELEGYKVLFAQVDEDNSGAIDEQELGSLMMACRESKVKGSRLKAMFEAVDIDQSGTLCFNEFVRMMYDLREGRHNAFGAVLGRAVYAATVSIPGKAIHDAAKRWDDWLNKDSKILYKIELCNDVRTRLETGEESFEEICASLSANDIEIITAEGINKWS
jgi:hypothetical protein